MRKILLSILALSMLLASTLVGCECSSSLTILSITEGEVFVMKAGTGNWVEAQVGMSLEPGDMIRTGDGSNAEITFFEGSTIELQAGTEIEVVVLGIARDTGSTTVRLGQTIGRTIFRVTKIIDPASRYEVETPTGLVAVRGSAVEIYVIEDGTSLITNIAGDIRAIAQGVEVRIPEGAGAIIRPDEAPELTGPWVDEVIITVEGDHQAAGLNIRSGVTDMYDPLYTAYYDQGPWRDYLDFLEQAKEHPEVDLVLGYGAYRDLRFNTYRDPYTKEPIFNDGRLSPFAVPAIREAMNWLIDRQHIVDEYQGGIGSPKWTALGTQFPDHKVHYPHIVVAIEEYYAHDPDKAAGIIGAEMEKLGAGVVDGKWHYQDEPVEIIVLIRAELPPFPAAGHYVADLMEGLGFAVVRLVLPLQEASQIWIHTHPSLGAFHIYTGGWGTTMVSRDQGSIFEQMYTHRVMVGFGLWQILEEQLEEFGALGDASRRLRFREFATMEEREELFETVLWEAMKFSNCIWIAEFAHASLLRHDVGLAIDAALGALSPMWAYTVHFRSNGEPVAGGILRVEMAEMLVGPWNPVAGSAARVDRFAGAWALGDRGTLPDTRDGLCWPQRIERAEVLVQSGLPVGVTNTDWCTLAAAPEIQVPLDAWADWDAVNQRFLTVNDRFGSEGTTALSKSVSYYPKEIFEVPLHDGSTLSTGDFILYTILQFDRAKPDSAIYDDSAVAEYNALMGHFKGVRFITDDPDYGLIVEYYSDQWQLDAELMVTTMFPFYSQGPGMWHTIALGIRAEQDRALAFSQAKSNALGVAWANFIDGPSLSILEGYLDTAKASSYIPYEPTMRLYVTEAEAAERWSNLEEWYAEKGHIWVGSGPFYLESVDTTQKIIHLKRFQDYPDPMDRWLFLLEPLP